MIPVDDLSISLMVLIGVRSLSFVVFLEQFLRHWESKHAVLAVAWLVYLVGPVAGLVAYATTGDADHPLFAYSGALGTLLLMTGVFLYYQAIAHTRLMVGVLALAAALGLAILLYPEAGRLFAVLSQLAFIFITLVIIIFRRKWFLAFGGNSYYWLFPIMIFSLVHAIGFSFAYPGAPFSVKLLLTFLANVSLMIFFLHFEYHQSQTRLSDSEERYRFLFAAAPVAMWEEDAAGIAAGLAELRSQGVADIRQYFHAQPEFLKKMIQKSRVLDVNQEAISMLEASSKQETISRLERPFSPESHRAFAEAAACLYEGVGQTSIEAVVETLRGTKRDVVIDIRFPNSDNPKEVTIVSMVDITDSKRIGEELERHRRHLEDMVQKRTTELDVRIAEAEELNSAMVNVMEDLKVSNLKLEATGRELVASNKELDAFSYSVSHDLRAPLRHVDGFVTLLLKREEGRLDPTSSRYLETVAESSSRMGRLIDDLLNFSRTGRTKAHFERVDSNEVIREVRTGLSPLTEGRHVTWEIGDLPAVEADRSLLRLVWENLIANAIKYTAPREEAHIQIGTTGEGVDEETGEIAFFVRDNGVGFDPRYTHKLFGVFQRLHRDDEFEGTGIGLATVQRIVHRHGGRVWAEGEVDHGATFYFTLKETGGEE